MLAWGCLPATIVILECIIALRNRFVNTTLEVFSLFLNFFASRIFVQGHLLSIYLFN